MTIRETLSGAGCFFVLCLGLSSCASPSDVSDLRAQVDTLSTKMTKIERQNAGGEGVSGGTQLADIETRLDNQKLRIARLRDRIERMNHRLDQLMNRIEAQAPQPAPKTPGGAQSATSPPVPGSPAAAGSLGVAAGAAPQKSSESPDMIYHQAYADYQAGHFDIAISEFDRLVREYPDSHLASSAVFWAAQSHFNLSHYKRALALYDAVIHKYVDSPKKATSYYKKGQVYEKLGNKKAAIKSYKRVLELFPLEPQLDDLAKRRLSRLDE
ncbi:MAG: tetratricopeptide repeat protein [Leptospirales bacterium]